MGRNQCKKAENTRNQNASPPTGDHSSSLERDQGLIQTECDELTESGSEACTSFNSRIDQAGERISEIEDQLNEIKQEGKIREKRVKSNEQSLQEIWVYVKRPNLRFIGVAECDEENESKLENTLQDIIQENFPNLARQANIQVQEIQRTPQRYSSRRATPRHIIVRFTRVETKEEMLRAAREKVRVTHKGEAHQTHSSSLSRNPTSQKRSANLRCYHRSQYLNDNSSPAGEQSCMENESDELTETGFR
ncbi:LINE-1 retrotransposable element ORF1 protein, partial [Plecturocebus cupreus]